jgi:hypothetical protein
MAMLAAVGALALIWASSEFDWHQAWNRPLPPVGARGPAQRVPGAPEIPVDRPFKVLDANAAIR